MLQEIVDPSAKVVRVRYNTEEAGELTRGYPELSLVLSGYDTENIGAEERGTGPRI